jgi:hypothetical protein
MLRGALGAEPESDIPVSDETAVKSKPEFRTERFENYEVLKREDGKPVELGRGAMGVTYKAF